MTRRQILVPFACLLGFAVCGTVLCVVLGIRNSLEAEETLHAYITAIRVVEQFVEQHDGQWPRSWADLETIQNANTSAMWEWPHDQKEIAERVQVDFALSSAQVAEMTPTTFSAIVQIGPNFGQRETEVSSLITTVQKSLAKARGPQESESGDQ